MTGYHPSFVIVKNCGCSVISAGSQTSDIPLVHITFFESEVPTTPASRQSGKPKPTKLFCLIGLVPLPQRMLSGEHKYVTPCSSHFVPVPVYPSFCLYLRPPYLQSSSHFPSTPMTGPAKAIHHYQWTHIYANLRPLTLSHKLDGEVHQTKAMPVRMVFPHHCHTRPALSETVMQPTIHFHPAPIYYAVLPINQAWVVSSSLWYPVTMMNNMGIWATFSHTYWCPLILFVLGSKCNSSSHVKLLLILMNSDLVGPRGPNSWCMVTWCLMAKSSISIRARYTWSHFSKDA